jgi:hypothetical protein
MSLIDKVRQIGVKEVAQRTDIDYNQLIMWCNGLRKFSDERIVKIKEVIKNDKV